MEKEVVARLKGKEVLLTKAMALNDKLAR